jgi:hypothetical protein
VQVNDLRALGPTRPLRRRRRGCARRAIETLVSIHPGPHAENAIERSAPIAAVCNFEQIGPPTLGIILFECCDFVVPDRNRRKRARNAETA